MADRRDLTGLSLEQKRALLAEALRNKAGKAKTFPVSFAQQRLWFLHQWQPDSPVYNIPANLRLRGALDAEALARALAEVVRRHESLRTTFPVVDGQPVQRVAPPVPVDLTVIDLTYLPQRQRRAEAWRRMAAEKQRSFDLATGPLFRATLLRLGEEHLLQLVVHHIVSDGWSQGILIRELTALYEAFRAGRPTPLLELPLQYADFAVWQRSWLQGDVLQQQLDYWKARLAGLTPLELPTDRPRPAVQSFQGAWLRLRMPAELAEGLRALAQREGATLFMTLLAAFKVLLARYSGQHDVTVGSAIAGRQRKELEGIIGFFVNTLVLRTDLSGDPGFRELLRRVRETCVGAYAHQDIPFEKLVEEVQPQRDPSRNPLFQVSFTLQSGPQTKLQPEDLESEAVQPDVPARAAGKTLPSGNGTSKFDISLTLTDRAEGLVGELAYSTDLFEEATVDRLAVNFQTLLEGITAQPDAPLSLLPVLAEQEQRLVRGWNETAAAYPADVCLHDLIEAQVERTPGAVALVFESERLTYGELNARANQLAHYLRRLGVGPDVPVALCLERSIEMVVALLGVLKAGGAYVPLDPDYPGERLAFMLADAGAPVLLTQQRLLGRLEPRTARVLCLDADWQVVAAQSSAAPAKVVVPGHLAYILYTSGSTGKPKGVQIPHSAVVNFLRSMREAPGLSEQDTLLAVTTLSFDIAGLELYLPLIVGARLHLVSREVTQDAVRLMRELSGLSRVVMQATPATWRMLLEAGWAGHSGLAILCGGEALPADLAQKLLPCAGSLWNMYGPTETTIWSTIHRIDQPAQSVPIGRPIANTQVYVVDDRRQPVPVGVAGELLIGGAGVARGYLNRTGLTAEKFIPDPFAAQPGGRLYRTGDLVRWLADGNLEFLGRIDHQVKVRGFRIELGEVESCLARHSAVREAVVVARDDLVSGRGLVAYLVTAGEPPPAVDELRALLRERLPDYMVPAAFVFLEALPLTPSGKIDRKTLPAPASDCSELADGFTAPRTPVEEAVAAIWVDVLRVKRVGVNDNFFERGGHSLLATQVIARLRQTLGVEVPLRFLFEAPTVAGLAEQVETARWLARPTLASMPADSDMEEVRL